MLKIIFRKIIKYKLIEWDHYLILVLIHISNSLWIKKINLLVNKISVKTI